MTELLGFDHSTVSYIDWEGYDRLGVPWGQCAKLWETE